MVVARARETVPPASPSKPSKRAITAWVLAEWPRAPPLAHFESCLHVVGFSFSPCRGWLCTGGWGGVVEDGGGGGGGGGWSYGGGRAPV